MAHKELNGKEDFTKALETKGRYVFIYAHDSEVPAPAQDSCRNAKKFSETTDAYGLNVAKYPVAKDHFKIEKVPTAIVYKDGKEIKRVDEMSQESIKEVEQILLS
ncbi:hypothetical protein BDV96DRAFT_607769 [Lophiotrema nucula]|uniref:Thioredoxin domain-containing protein n=1 Tax=Lophiotrema nucula TaxID=690887 RepID=A0A6A5YIE7_9PLEO|nr:hypothetical protein BDV96DRAFT_607769 [Lophiotrema nucula]